MAVQILQPTHPLHMTFIRWLVGKAPTKRQARKFLQKYPQFRGALNGA